MAMDTMDSPEATLRSVGSVRHWEKTDNCSWGGSEGGERFCGSGVITSRIRESLFHGKHKEMRLESVGVAD
jgi:hypothetical protein